MCNTEDCECEWNVKSFVLLKVYFQKKHIVVCLQKILDHDSDSDSEDESSDSESDGDGKEGDLTGRMAGQQVVQRFFTWWV